MKLSDLPAYFDVIDRLEGIVSTFLNADWAGAYRRRGIAGLFSECVACLTGYNAPTIYVSRNSDWRGIDIEHLLRRHGVKVWDRGILGDELYFCVKRRQVKWAEYVLLRAGVPIVSTLIEPRNRHYARRHPVGSEPHSHTKKRIRRDRRNDQG
ncbi:MAG: hypothetical protein RMN25_08950 [Anaerolineae bacterium]|nr:hypothetical protein [Thermoflexales bacterium]MDW8407901.1 hypothetical protein [Anaerolineae bacterium]